MLINNGALPLASDAKVSTVSHSSGDIITCGTGAADIDTSTAPTLKEALEGVGLTVNPTLWDFYKGLDAIVDENGRPIYARTPGKLANQTSGATREAYFVNEVPVSEYTGDVKSSFASYNDAAIVTIARISGEGADLANDGFVDGTNILELTQNEKDMLEMVQENFETVIVLINSTNAMDCSFLYEYEIDAALWIGYTGEWGLTLAMFIGVEYDDPAWEDLLGQLTFEEMATLIGQGYHNTAAMPSVGKPATVDDNGPQGFTQSLTGVAVSVTAYTDENTMAATFNVELMEDMGEVLGEDCMELGASGLYGPAMNIHRNAYAGRNFEYYSEDPFLSGAIAAAETKGIQSKGVYVYLKHYALNDNETGCRCISTFANEQSIREIYLKPFQMAVEDGDAHAIMNAFARVGVEWSGAHYGMMTETLRNEWGFDGFVLTDFSGNAAIQAYGMFFKSFDVAYGLLGGTDSWDASATQWTDDLLNLYRNDPDICQAMRQTAHRILYTVANSNAMNGLDSNARIVAVPPWWQMALYCLIGVFALGTLLCGWKWFVSVKNKKNA